MSKTLEEQIRDGIKLREAALADIPRIEATARTIAQALRQGRFLYVFGNGGSAADAQHLAAELSGKFYKDREPLPAFALTANSSAVTAIGNDFGYEHTFSRQLKGCVRAGDIVIGISTSGTSKNVVEAMEVAKKAGAKTVALCGRKGKPLAQMSEHALTVESDDVARIQEIHEMYYHLLCFAVEKELFD
ncbi:MAG: SIS domain-containing protein [Candidatus Thermoplasmatota archaeon]